MDIYEVTPREYHQAIPNAYHVYNSALFNSLNSHKCERVSYCLFKEGKYRLGIILGLNNNVLLSPFSAPFGGFSYLSNDISIEYIEKAIDTILSKLHDIGISSIVLTMPPFFYNVSFISKTINSLFRKHFLVKHIDLNYAFDLSSFTDQYVASIWRNARKNLNISFSNNLNFVICNDINEKKAAYDIIKYNREQRGFPLRMTWNQVFETTSLIKSDFFLVQSPEGYHMASAIVFHVKENDIVQVVYWGDKPEYSENKTMNFLSYKIFEFYKHNGLNYVDIGPSSEGSQPNYGLCEFKESIGCFISPKITLTYVKQ